MGRQNKRKARSEYISSDSVLPSLIDFCYVYPSQDLHRQHTIHHQRALTKTAKEQAAEAWKEAVSRLLQVSPYAAPCYGMLTARAEISTPPRHHVQDPAVACSNYPERLPSSPCSPKRPSLPVTAIPPSRLASTQIPRYPSRRSTRIVSVSRTILLYGIGLIALLCQLRSTASSSSVLLRPRLGGSLLVLRHGGTCISAFQAARPRPIYLYAQLHALLTPL